MKKIIITGGKGFFGSRFLKMWEKKYRVLTPGSKELDVTDEKIVNAYLLKERPDYVIHAAAIPDQQYCIEHPQRARAVNVDGAINVAKACKKINAKLVFISTEQVFNGSKEAGPYSEESEPCPNTVYGENKLEVENRLPDILQEYWIVRFTWLFGLPERDCALGSNILWDTIQSLLAGKTITTTHYEYRGMSDVKEICINLEKLFSAPYGIYHFGSINDLGRYDVVKYIMELLGVDQQIIEDRLISDDSHYTKDDPRDLRLDTTKATQAGLIFMPTKEAIKNCLLEFGIIK